MSERLRELSVVAVDYFNLFSNHLKLQTFLLKSLPHLVVTAAAEENNRGKPADMDSSRGERRRSPRLSASSSRPPAMATSTPLTPVAEERRRRAPSTPASTLSNASSLSSKGSPRLQGNAAPRLSLSADYGAVKRLNDSRDLHACTAWCYGILSYILKKIPPSLIV